MWTEQNAAVIQQAAASFKQKGKYFRVADFLKHLSESYSVIAVKLSRYRWLKPNGSGLTGRELIESSIQRNLCQCCERKLLPLISRVCEDCLQTDEGKLVSKQAWSKAVKASNLISYGVANPMHDASVAKRQATAIRKTFQFESDEIVEKRRVTSQKRYGTDRPTQNAEIADKVSDSMLDAWSHNGKDILSRRRDTCTERYGSDSASRSDEVKAKQRRTNQERHGVDNPMQLREVQIKAARSMQSLHRVKCDGKVYECQGYERFVIPLLVKKFGSGDVKCQFDEGFKSFWLGDRSYTPDVYVESTDTYYEIKSWYTLLGFQGNSNHLKRNRMIQRRMSHRGHKLKFVLFDEKAKTPHVLPSGWHEQSREQLSQNIANLG